MLQPLNPGDQAGGWTVERVVRLGARSNTYLVAQGDDRAILRLLRAPDGGMAERLVRNAAVAYELNDRNVVRVRGVIEHQGCPGVLSTYFPNAHSILSWSQARPRDLPAILEVFEGVFFGLKVLHDAGLIHRNLKASKILLVRTRAGQVPKIEDILLSRAEGTDSAASVTAVGEAIGAPHTMPPEQHIAASTVDHRADLYSAGALLYEALTGTPPFHAATLVGLVRAKKRGRFRPASVVRPDVPLELDQLLSALLAPEPADRPADAEIVLEQVHRIWSSTRSGTMSAAAHRTDADWSGWFLVAASVLALGLFVLALLAVFAG